MTCILNQQAIDVLTDFGIINITSLFKEKDMEAHGTPKRYFQVLQ